MLLLIEYYNSNGNGLSFDLNTSHDWSDRCSRFHFMGKNIIVNLLLLLTV